MSELVQPIQYADFIVERKLRDSSPVFSRSIQEAPELSALGITIQEPHERKDNGAIEYTTIPEAITHWAEDPHGIRTVRFIGEAYGIPEQQVPRTLTEAGMEEYLKYKAEGRFVGMVSTQVEKPTYYFMANALALGELSRKGIPTALMMLEYPDDTFYTGNADKRLAFGKIEFPVDVVTKQDPTTEDTPEQDVKSVSIELKPYGIRQEDGTIQRIKRLDEANGYKCGQVLVQVVDAKGPNNQPYAKVYEREDPKNPGTKVSYKRALTLGALGMEIPGLQDTKVANDKNEDLSVAEDSISITDLYKHLWIQTIEHMRETGELPSADDMPMFFVDGLKLYSTLAKEAQPSAQVLETLKMGNPRQVLYNILKIEDPRVLNEISQDPVKYTEYLASHGLQQLPNGLLVHPNGMMDPSSYYAAQTAWPDLYLECSSCGGDYFVDKIARSQAVQDQFGLSHKEVRLPDAEVEGLEKYAVHPTGMYFNYQLPPDDRILELNNHIRDIYEKAKKKKEISRAQAEKLTRPYYDEIAQLREDAWTDYVVKMQSRSSEFFTTGRLTIPPDVAATYKYLFKGVDQALRQPTVQRSIRYAQNLNWNDIEEEFAAK